MPTTARMGWPFPSENQDPWYDALTAFFAASDLSVYASRETENLVLTGGGDVTFAAGAVSWTVSLDVLAPITGFKWEMLPTSLTIADGEMLWFDAVRAPSANTTVVPRVSGQLPLSDTAVLLAVRRGTTLFWRNGAGLAQGLTVNPLAFSPGASGVLFAGDSGAGGAQGEVPAPAAGDFALKKYLSAGGAWRVINQDDLSPGFSIASFVKASPNPGVLLYRRGDTLTGIAAAATYVSGPPTSASIANALGGSVGGGDINPAAWTIGSPFAAATHPTNVKREGTDLGADPTWTVTLNATGTAVDSENFVVTWTRDVYFGVGAAGLNTEAAIEGLASNALAVSRFRTITVSPSNQKVYYAYPKSYGVATFTLNGFPAAFNVEFELSLTNTNGITSTYYVYESVNLLTGTNLNFVVT